MTEFDLNCKIRFLIYQIWLFSLVCFHKWVVAGQILCDDLLVYSSVLHSCTIQPPFCLTFFMLLGHITQRFKAYKIWCHELLFVKHCLDLCSNKSTNYLFHYRSSLTLKLIKFSVNARYIETLIETVCR